MAKESSVRVFNNSRKALSGINPPPTSRLSKGLTDVFNREAKAIDDFKAKRLGIASATVGLGVEVLKAMKWNVYDEKKDNARQFQFFNAVDALDGILTVATTYQLAGFMLSGSSAVTSTSLT